MNFDDLNEQGFAETPEKAERMLRNAHYAVIARDISGPRVGKWLMLWPCGMQDNPLFEKKDDALAFIAHLKAKGVRDADVVLFRIGPDTEVVNG